ncbi:unnamed protein product [Chironomus riparius]|uniref:Uncharacterized protein n=1 Tax=Chironomus riparius TaxID=315576 RepID=A0A9N9WN26_9DIPT|nr:unnamed protein product [Chironomus riparius]
MDFDEIPSGSKQNLKKQRKQVPEKKTPRRNLKFQKIISQIKLQVKPAFKISSAATTQVIVKNVEDKASIISVLRSQCIPFHTFSEKSEKTKSFVLKGFYETPTNEKPFYLVHFQDESVNFNCQRWGHSSQNCGYKFRCVKCTEVHGPNQCQRSTRDGNAKCINCNGDHAASYRLCPSFISYSKRIEKSRAKPQLKMLRQISSLWDSNNFPSLSKRHQVSAHSHPVNAASNSSATFQEDINQQQLINNTSYAEKLNEAVMNVSLFKKFTEAQERLKRIPNIEEAINQFCSFVDEAGKIPKDAPQVTAFKLMVKYGFMSCPPAPNKPVQK